MPYLYIKVKRVGGLTETYKRFLPASSAGLVNSHLNDFRRAGYTIISVWEDKK